MAVKKLNEHNFQIHQIKGIVEVLFSLSLSLPFPFFFLEEIKCLDWLETAPPAVFLKSSQTKNHP